MNLQIRPLRDDDLAAVVDLSLLAWAPVFQSFERILGSPIYSRMYPDWHKSQSAEVTAVCQDHEKNTVWVAEVEGQVAGFVACRFNYAEETGEVYMLAVHPDYQNQGIGTGLNTFALDQMRAVGMKMAFVGTGGDPAHAPARRSYEKVGYTALPIVQYYQIL